MVKTLGFHPGDTGSTPVPITKFNNKEIIFMENVMTILEIIGGVFLAIITFFIFALCRVSSMNSRLEEQWELYDNVDHTGRRKDL